MSEVIDQVMYEIFKENPWVIVVDNFLQNPAFIAVLSAIGVAIVMYGVSRVFSLELKFDFGAEERAYNEGYLEGFKKAVEELSISPNDSRSKEEPQ